MPHIASKDVFPRFLESATHSSHFLWFLIPLQFYQTEKQGWIYAYLKIGSVTLFPLEPLIPPTSDATHFEETWAEVKSVIQPETSAFVAVYEWFKNVLVQNSEFQVLKIGHEPWVDLKNFFPKGNTGKGVRGARNQAARHGVWVEEWKPDSEADRPLRHFLEKNYQEWRKKRFMSTDGFLNASQPFYQSEERRYFVAYSPQKEVQGFLIATPIKKNESYFLEDLILKPHVLRGVGEILTLEAMETLSNEGAKRASLGVISLTEIDSTSPHPLPALVALFIKTIPPILKKFYNFEGMEIFRKRFQPYHWEPIFLCVEMNENTSPTSSWLKVASAIVKAFQVKFEFKLSTLWESLKNKWGQYPLTYSFATVSLFLFGIINHFGDIPEKALRQFSFAPQAYWPEWFYRTYTSDLLFFNFGHFLFCYPLYVFLLYQLERTQKRFFAVSFVLLTHFFDDFVNYFLIIKPFHFLEASVYFRLVTFKDVGCSLGMVTVLGFMVNSQLRRNRELILIVITLALVFGYIFATPQFTSFVLNLNHFLFFILGYVVGKIKFELMRKKSKKASKGKTPLVQKQAP